MQIRKCNNCVKEFNVHEYSIKNGHGKYCSYACKSESQTGMKRVTNNRECLTCEKSFYTAVRENKKYCSRPCYEKSPAIRTTYKRTDEMKRNQLKQLIEGRKRMVGALNHAWKGGVTPKNKKIRESSEYNEWRIHVFNRDDFTCQKCGQRGEKLHADHVFPFSLYPDLRLEILNGQTLCVKCHHHKTKTDLRMIKLQTI